MPMYLCVDAGSMCRRPVANSSPCCRTPTSLHNNFLAFPTLLAISSRKFKLFWHFVRRGSSSHSACSRLPWTPSTPTCRNTLTKKLHSWHPKYWPAMKMRPPTSSSAPKPLSTTSLKSPKNSNQTTTISSQRLSDCSAMTSPPKSKSSTGPNSLMPSRNTS